jgi:mannose-6-phosphate isomerase-like protein (cupin superfamily)
MASEGVRRVATGHDPEGRAVFVEDIRVPVAEPPLMPGLGFQFLWHQAAAPVLPGSDQPQGPGPYFPLPGGVRWLVFTIPALRQAPPEGTDLAAAAARTEALLPGLRATMEPDNPGMHRSDTVDFVYVLEGEIVLELDDGRETTLRCGDTLVQNGTRHAWRNRSGQPCRLLVVMLGAARQAG